MAYCMVLSRCRGTDVEMRTQTALTTHCFIWIADDRGMMSL